MPDDMAEEGDLIIEAYGTVTNPPTADDTATDKKD